MDESKLDLIVYKTQDLISVSVVDGGVGFEISLERDAFFGKHYNVRFIGDIDPKGPAYAHDLERAYGFGIKRLHEYYFEGEVNPNA